MWPFDRTDEWDYAQREHAKRWFSKLGSMLRLRVEWADDKMSPIPYQLVCTCFVEWPDCDERHDELCPAAQY
jgi:hypothetical protein